MKMKGKLLFAPTVMVIMAALVVTTTTTTTRRPAWTTRSTGRPGLNLNGKMFTLSAYGGGITFYPPDFPSPWTSPSPWSTPRYARPTTTTTTPPYTTRAPSTRSVSVCLRYVTDVGLSSSFSLFTLKGYSNPLSLGFYAGSYTLRYNDYDSLYLRPSIRFWRDIPSGVWTSVCLTVDSFKNVAQVFSNSNMSIRRILTRQFWWSGEPVIDLTGFDGQVTDVQMWDYPLRYKEVYSYMTRGFYGPYRGSVLTWSSISYTPRGFALMEDAYDGQAKQPIRGRRGRHLKGEEIPRRFFRVGRSQERERQSV